MRNDLALARVTLVKDRELFGFWGRGMVAVRRDLLGRPLLPDDRSYAELVMGIDTSVTGASYAERASDNSVSSAVPHGDRWGNLEMAPSGLRDEMERSKAAL